MVTLRRDPKNLPTQRRAFDNECSSFSAGQGLGARRVTLAQARRVAGNIVQVIYGDKRRTACDAYFGGKPVLFLSDHLVKARRRPGSIVEHVLKPIQNGTSSSLIPSLGGGAAAAGAATGRERGELRMEGSCE